MDWRFLPSAGRQRGRGSKRIKVLSLAFVIFSALIILRLFDLMILHGSFYSALALGQHELYQKLFPQRGEIYVVEKDGDQKKLFPLVTNRTLPSLYAVPREIEDASSTAAKLIEILGPPEAENSAEEEKKLFADLAGNSNQQLVAEIKVSRREKLLQEKTQAAINDLNQRLSDQTDVYEPLRSKLTADQVTKIKALKIMGLGFQDQDYRFYTDKGLGGQLFGFVGYRDNKLQGNYGLEGYFDKILTGKQGEITSERDALGNLIAIGQQSFIEKEDGAQLVLTIDRAIQYRACQELKNSIELHQAKGGSIIIIKPQTGAILAMCSFPDYDPNEYYKVPDLGLFNNPAIFNTYEPGSVFKTITMAAALNEGKITPETVYTDMGLVDFGQYKIRNFNDKVYGVQTMTQVLETSINTGAIFAMRQIGPSVFTKYVKAFGFGEPTGIELAGEINGDIANLSKKGEIFAATASFGQGISVTPLQMAAAFASIANGGKLMKPYLVSQIITGDKITNIEPQEVRQVISPKTAALLSGMLVSVVENGHAKKAQIAGYRVAGKTGTAQIPKPGGGYMSDDHIIGSFVGFAPFNNPQFAMLIRVDEPQEGRLGETVAGPVFANVGKFILQYYNVPYDKPFDKK